MISAKDGKSSHEHTQQLVIIQIELKSTAILSLEEKSDEVNSPDLCHGTLRYFLL